MKFYEYGSREKPVIVMLSGSFCPACALDYLYIPLSESNYIIVPEYNGHYEGSSAFTTRRKEAALVAKHLSELKINAVDLVYGQSMGCEVGIELIHQLIDSGVDIRRAIFDGAPCIRLSKPYKVFMYFKFKTMINMMRNKSVDEVMSWKFLNKFTNGDTQSLRPMIESLIEIAPFLTKESIKNENECCYSFDFPQLPESIQRNMHFLYGSGEKAYKTCHKLVKKAYPHSLMTVFEGYGHMTYSLRHTEEYLKLINNDNGSLLFLQNEDVILKNKE